MEIITELPTTAMTLRPATKRDEGYAKDWFPYWESAEDGRFVVRPVHVIEGEAIPMRVTLWDEWRLVVVWEGLIIKVRAAECGLGCRCAGEFSFEGLLAC